MPSTLEFLQAVLPFSGDYCAVTIINKKAKQRFFNTVEELADFVTKTDKLLDGDAALYHGCAAYIANDRTKQRAIRSLWLDIDVGPDKPYADLEEALKHVREFVTHAGLPNPILVCSGNGVHVYWPLDVELSVEQWTPLAQALKAACQKFGLRAGPERTADRASILRPPGTTHRKGKPPRPVVCGPLAGPYKLEAFNGLHASSNHREHIVLIRSGSSRNNNAPLADYLNVHSPEPIDFDKLSKDCAQVGSFRSTRGNISEPIWYAVLGVFGFAYDGDRVAHEWSSGHPNYSFNETQGKLDRVKQLSGPTTCEKIKSLNPTLCEGCTFGSSTPLEAGRTLSPVLRPGIHTEDKKGTETPQEDNVVLEGMAIEGHPEYQFKKGGLYHVTSQTKGTKGPPAEVKLSDQPIRISAVHVGEIEREKYFYHFQHYKPHNGWHDVIVKPSEVHGQTMSATLANHGMVIHDPVRFHMYIKDSVDSLNRKRRAEMSYQQFGWKEGGKFLFGDRLYGPNGCEPAAIHQGLKFRSQWLKPAPGGSLLGWKDAVDNLMGRGSEGMSLTVLASFASVLMPFFDAQEGGAALNLMTRHSGAGKTTALSGALTVWTSDPRALELISIDTKVSKALSLGALCNIPCIYDEFDNKDPDAVHEFFTMFTSGRDKMRGNADATVTLNAASWRMLFITASNASIQDTIMSTGRSEAPAMRVLELPVESSGTMKPSELMDIAKKLYANGGWAGEAFISYLVQPGVVEWVRDKLSELLDEITERGGFKKEHRFWVRALAAIGCAALIVEELGLVSFNTHRIMEWALEHFGQNSKTLKAEPVSMIEHLSAYLNASIGETLIMPGEAEGRRLFAPIGAVPKYRVNIRIEVKNEICYLAIQPLRKWLEANAGGGYTELLRELFKAHMLKDAAIPKTLTVGTEMSSGQVKCVMFDIGHPKFTGFMREVKQEAKHTAIIRKLIDGPRGTRPVK